MDRKIKNIFVEGAISPKKIAESIGHHQSKTKIGAHNIFLGQVRADQINGKTISAIDYSAQKEIANQLRENSEHLGRIETIDTGKMLKETRWQAKYIAELTNRSDLRDRPRSKLKSSWLLLRFITKM
mgnify:CR=1 FL=1